MNKVILMGRLVRDPDVRYSNGENGAQVIVNFTLAVDRKIKKTDQAADFINCVSFGKTAEFLEKYAKQGTKFVVEGRIQTGSYTNKEGQKVYTTNVAVESVEFAESKSSSSQENQDAGASGGFMNIPDGIEDEGLPFN